MHTGRSAAGQVRGRRAGGADEIWWGKVNQRLAAEKFADSEGPRCRPICKGQELFTQDLYAGADPAHRIRVRLVTTEAWHALFARNMFIRPPRRPSSPVSSPTTSSCTRRISRPTRRVDGVPQQHRDRAVVRAAAHRHRRHASMPARSRSRSSRVMNWMLPAEGVLPMHCSANIGRDGDVALFFGLSGTGKTTLSSDPQRSLIGDDEHGWATHGVFNFEGGCYAKVINLSARGGAARSGPPPTASARCWRMWSATSAAARPHRRLADREHPVLLPGGVHPERRAERPRRAAAERGDADRDAFGVLPPIAKLTPAQAMYHFLSGYTALVAGTEKGLGAEPQATFSTCFGAPFLPRRPEVYGRMLADLIARHGADCWLVNTGWSGGAYGVGKRMSIQHTRALLRAALDGTLAHRRFREEPFFGLQIPEAVPRRARRGAGPAPGLGRQGRL